MTSSALSGCASGQSNDDQGRVTDSGLPALDAGTLPVRALDGGYPSAPATPREGGASEATSQTEPPTGDASPANDAGAPPPEPRCTPEAGPDEPDEDFVDSNCDGIDGDASAAIFVAPTGSDSAAGDLSAPVRTVAHGIELAAAAGKSVYVCDAEYEEAVTLTEGVSLYGGYACDRGWLRELDRATLVPKSGVPFTAKNLKTPITVQRFAFRAPDATGSGGSSLAASVVGVPSLTFTRVLFVAGNATKGADGKAVPDPTWVPQGTLAAADAKPLQDAASCHGTPGGDWFGDPNCLAVAAGASAGAKLCPDGSLIQGGTGGNGGNFYWSLSPTEGSPGLSSPASKLAGRNGESGEAGSSFGAILDGAYNATNNGTAGAAGHGGLPGRGGVGGASQWTVSPGIVFWPGGGGGQGGYGGCGGQAGKPGAGGGSSVALIVVHSGVSLDASALQTGLGGDGGNGSDGSPGESASPPGKGAAAPHSFAGADGAPGGNGGDGGSGGPGGGGPSIGIVFIGEAPTKTDSTLFDLGSAGRGGVSADDKGADGEREETYSAGK